MASLSDRAHAVSSLASRELRSSLFSAGMYVPVSLGFILATLNVKSYISSIQLNGMAMLSNPLNQPLYWTIIVAAVYLALSSAISIAKEKEQGTMEILFHGPVDMASFVLGKFFEHMAVYVVFSVIFAAFFWVVSLLTNFGMGVSFVSMIAVSIVMAACTISFGTLISALAPKVRNATFVFIGLVLLLLAMQILGTVLMAVQPDNFSSLAAYLRLLVQAITQVLAWISPFAYLTRGLTAIQIANTRSLLFAIGEGLAYVVATLYLAILVLKRRGVKRA